MLCVSFPGILSCNNASIWLYLYYKTSHGFQSNLTLSTNTIHKTVLKAEFKCIFTNQGHDVPTF